MKKIISTLKSVWAEFGMEALRTTLAAMIPAFAIAIFFQLDYAIPFVIGALNASMTDFPGHKKEKIVVAFWNTVCAACTVLIVGYSLPYPWLTIVLIGILAGIFTLMGAMGQRMMMVGVTSLFMITFVMGLRPPSILDFALFAGLGTIWFHGINLIHSYINPHWEARRLIRNTFRMTSKLLRIKAQCYEPNQHLDSIYQQVASLSIKLADQHESIRHLILRKHPQQKWAKEEYALWLQGYILMDLYSLSTAVDYDYAEIQDKLSKIGVLDKVHNLVLLTAEAIESVASRGKKFPQEFEEIVRKIDDLTAEIENAQVGQSDSTIEILNGVIKNAQSFLHSIERLLNNKGDELVDGFYSRKIDVSGFLSPLSTSISNVRTHIRMRTPLFLFALRMSLLFFLGGVAGELLSDMKYTYWIFMTIIVVARPSYALTWQRNSQRTWGTIGGILLGVTLVSIVSNTYIQLFFIAFLLFCFLLFNRAVYMVSVFFITASVIIALHLHDGTVTDILTSRFVFTLVGCTLAILGWFMVPISNKNQIKALFAKALDENQNFYEAVLTDLREMNYSHRADMRLARKRAFLAMAKLSDNVIQSQKEPGHSPANKKSVGQWHNDIYRLHAMISNLSLQDGYFDLSVNGEQPDLKLQRIDKLLDQLRQQSN